MKETLLIFERGCSNCEDQITDLRLKEGLLCQKCLETLPKGEDILELLKQKGKLQKLKFILRIQKRIV